MLHKDLDIYYIGYITIKKIDDYEMRVFIAWILCICVLIMQVDILKKNGNKYLIYKIKAINVDECDYGEDYMKIKFNSDDDLPLNKLLKFHIMTIIIRCVINENGKLYPQLFLDDTLYELV